MSNKNELMDSCPAYKHSTVPQFIKNKCKSAKKLGIDEHKEINALSEFEEIIVDATKVENYIKRKKLSIANSPSVKVQNEWSLFKIIIENPKSELIEYLRMIPNMSKLEKVKTTFNALFELAKHYGYFLCNEKMLRINKERNPVVWINENFHENIPSFPITTDSSPEIVFVSRIKETFKEILTIDENIQNKKDLLDYIDSLLEKPITNYQKTNRLRSKTNQFITSKFNNSKKLNDNIESQSMRTKPRHPFLGVKSFSPYKKFKWDEKESFSNYSKFSSDQKNPEKEERSKKGKLIKELLLSTKIRRKTEQNEKLIESASKTIENEEKLLQSSERKMQKLLNFKERSPKSHLNFKLNHLSHPTPSLKVNNCKSTASIKDSISQCQSVRISHSNYENEEISDFSTNNQISSSHGNDHFSCNCTNKQIFSDKKSKENQNEYSETNINEENFEEFPEEEKPPLIRINICEVGAITSTQKIHKIDGKCEKSYRKRSEDIGNIWFNSRKEIEPQEFKKEKIVRENLAFSSRDTVSSMKIISKRCVNSKKSANCPSEATSGISEIEGNSGNETQSNKKQKYRVPSFITCSQKNISETSISISGNAFSTNLSNVENFNEKTLKIKEEDEISLETEINNILNGSFVPSETENETKCDKNYRSAKQSFLNVKVITESVITKELNSLFGDDSFFEEENKTNNYVDDFSHVLE